MLVFQVVVQLYFLIKEEGKREKSKVGKCHEEHRRGVTSPTGPALAHRGKICAPVIPGSHSSTGRQGSSSTDRKDSSTW